MPQFVYRKDNGEVSDRIAIPVGFIFDSRDKVLCLDVTDASLDEIRQIDELHREYLNKLNEAGFAHRFRSFFYDNIEQVVR
jgi:hypothetical protein